MEIQDSTPFQKFPEILGVIGEVLQGRLLVPTTKVPKQLVCISRNQEVGRLLIKSYCSGGTFPKFSHTHMFCVCYTWEVPQLCKVSAPTKKPYRKELNFPVSVMIKPSYITWESNALGPVSFPTPLCRSSQISLQKLSFPITAYTFCRRCFLKGSV